MCAIQIAFLFQVPELPVAGTCAELLVPNTVAFHGYAGLRKPNLPAGDKENVRSI